MNQSNAPQHPPPGHPYSQQPQRHPQHPPPPPPPPPPSQQQQQQASIRQRPSSPRSQPGQFQPPSQGPYVSPHSSTPSLPAQQYQSPYIGSGPNLPQHPPGEAIFYSAHPSPYSTHSAAPSYASSEPGESMATQSMMNRQQYPPMQSYQTPQSNSPASLASPQTDAHGRHFYQMPALGQQMYYPQGYHNVQQPAYSQHSSTSYHSPITSSSYHPPVTSAAPTLMSYPAAPQQQPSMHQQPPQQHLQHQQSHRPNPPPPAMIDTKPPLTSSHRPQPGMGAPHASHMPVSAQGTTPITQSQLSSLPPSSTSAAPGPIPATTPLVIHQDQNGVQWISFEYSRDKVKNEYRIRCDVEAVNLDSLSPEFKSANCVYPRACGDKDQYKGNRLHYETECNNVGWALAQLNPILREKRGLIQRAVDSWRNSNKDLRMRSRRVRRMAKLQTRKKAPAGGPGPVGGPSGLPAPGPQGAPVPSDYSLTPSHHPQQPPIKREEGMMVTPSSTPRTAHSFYPTYPIPTNPGAGTMQHLHGPMHPPHTTMALDDRNDEETEQSRKRKLFGDVSECKRRKFILVDDGQRGTRVRVRVALDQVKMDDMPDAHLKGNSVFPRSYYPRQTTPEDSSRAIAGWDDEDDGGEVLGVAGDLPTIGRTMVPVSLMDGSEATMAVPRMTTSRRRKEVALNEIGYRMSWGQARTFNGRTLFLQRSLDAYRNKMRSTMLAAGQDVVRTVPHFETRIGKRRWIDQRRRHARPDSP